MSRLPLEEGYFRMPAAEGQPPRLIGSYSPQANEYFFPRRKRCPITGGPVEDRELSPGGTLYSWTFLYENRFGNSARGEAGYGVGQVDLPEGVRIQARLLGAFDDWEIGMPMVLDLMDVWKDDEGNDLVTFCFRPKDGGHD